MTEGPLFAFFRRNFFADSSFLFDALQETNRNAALQTLICTLFTLFVFCNGPQEEFGVQSIKEAHIRPKKPGMAPVMYIMRQTRTITNIGALQKMDSAAPR